MGNSSQIIIMHYYCFCSNESTSVENGAVDATGENEECVLGKEEEEEEEEDANVLVEREEVEGGVMDGNTMEEGMELDGVVEVEVMKTPVVMDEGVKEEVEAMAADGEDAERSALEGVKEMEAAGGQPTDQVGRPLVLGSNPWTRPTGHNKFNQLVRNNEVGATGGETTGQVVWPPFLGFSIWSMPAERSQPDKKKGEEEEMTEEDSEVASIMSHLPPIVPTIREQPRSWLYEYDSYYSLF